MRRTGYLVGLMLMLVSAVALGSGRRALAGPTAAVVEVAAADFVFQPDPITINAGDEIKWTNTGQAPHTVTAADNSWDSGNMDSGQVFTRRFDAPGTYIYYCKYHGSGNGTGMAGRIVVQAQAQPTAAPTAAPPAAPTAVPAGQQPSIAAKDQPLMNNMITIERVVAAQDGWIAMHTNTAENKPGPVIGTAFVKAGESTNVTVQLSQTPNVGDKLWPMLHIDAGTMGTYEFPGPDVPVIVDGKVIMVQITITAPAPMVTPAIEAMNQPVMNTSITVARVVAAQDGWIAMHSNTAENKPGPVIGHAFVKAGESMNVSVPLSQTPMPGDKLWPMLHIDAGTLGTYEFPGPDVPVIVDGKVIMVQITVTEMPSVEAHDQPIVNNSITVAKVVAAQDGWIAMHTNTAENKPGPVIGTAFVKAGTTTNLKVQLSQTPNPGDKLWPMLHIDAATLGTYEFPGPDVPVIVNGKVIMVQITVTAPPPAQLPETAASGPSNLPLLGALALGLLLAGALLVRRRTA